MLVPFILVIVARRRLSSARASGRTSSSWWCSSAIGYGLLRADWPRAPFVIGLVLGKIAEESLHKALQLWGMDFFIRPLSLVLIGLIVAHDRLRDLPERQARAGAAPADRCVMNYRRAPA